MAKGGARARVRRLVPERIRWLARVSFRLLTGWYILEAMRRLRAIDQNFHLHMEQADAHAEIMDFFLRRLHILEEETAALARPLTALEQKVAELEQPLRKLEEEVTSWSQPMKAIAAKPTTPENGPSAVVTAGSEATERPPTAASVDGLNVAIVCRSLGRRCGIAEYSVLLAERLGVTPLASVAEVPLNTDVVFLEYEPSLYSNPADVIAEVDLIRPSTIVVVDAHNITPEVAEELPWHAIVGVKRSFYPGTVRLSHMQQLPLPRKQSPVKALRLGSFGFALPHKRYELVIELARRLGIGATILAAHSDATEWHSELSSSYLAQLKGLAGDGIEVVEDFLPVDEVLRQLRRCSHLVSCMEDNGAQSGSLRIMAAAGRPLISLPTEQAREVGATLVDDVDAITLEFLESCGELPQPYDGIADYHDLLQRLAWARSLVRPIYHGDSIYLDDPRQMERLDWLRANVSGRAVDIGVGNGFSTNYVRAVAGVEIRPDRLAYASLRYPHIQFHLLNASLQALAGFDTVVFGEIVEHMPFAESRQMVAAWAQTGPERMLITTPNAGKANYDVELVHNPEHVWEPTHELIPGLIPAGYRANAVLSREEDFLLVRMEKER